MPFSQLGLSDKVLGAIAAAGYTTPTPIQQQAIPEILATLQAENVPGTFFLTGAWVA